MPIKVVGIDPGLANCGLAILRLGATEEDDKVSNLQTITTSPNYSHKLTSYDYAERVGHISLALEPYVRKCDLVCSESMSYPRNSVAATKIALTFGAIVTLCKLYKKPLVFVLPQQLKSRIVGKRDASKEEVEIALLDRFPDIENLLENIPRKVRDHATDALGTIVAAYNLVELKSLRSKLRKRGD